MRVSTVDRVDWAPRGRRQPVEPRHGDPAPQLLTHQDRPIIAQLTEWARNDDDLAQLRRYLRFGLPYQKTFGEARLSGIKALNHWFGTIPPKPTRRRYACRYARLYADVPAFKPLIERITHDVVAPFKQLFPDAYRAHDDAVRQHIHRDWLIDNTPFTSGIINHTAALPYHRDSGNLADTWSVMLCLRDNVDGGHLDIPEYGVTLGVPDTSLVIFNGAIAWHGVTPLVFKQRGAYRFTLVWYVKADIARCACADDEPHRAAQHATLIHDEYAQPQ